MKKEKLYLEIVNNNKDRIYRICCYYFSDIDSRNEVYQEILIRIWKNLESFQDRSEISTWIFRIAVNSCLLYIKSEKKRKSLLHYSDSNEHYEIGDDHTEKKYFEDENISILYKSINQLPPVDKTIIGLLLEDMDYSQVAEITGLSEGNIRVRVHRAKQQLKILMEENFGT